MSPRGAGAVIAGLTLLVAVFIGLAPQSVSGGGVLGRSVDCGSAFSPNGTDAMGANLGAVMAGVSKDFEQQCSDALGAPRVISLGLIGASGLVLLFLALTFRSSESASVRESEHDSA